MSRPRKPANERLPQYVERRADGNLRLRYPVPADVRDAFPGRDGQGQRVVTRTLGTTDARAARPELTRLLAELDARVRRARAQTVSDEALEGHLRSLYSSTLSVADEIADSEADKERLRLFGAALPPPDARSLRDKLEAARREPLDLDQFKQWRVEAGRDIAGNGTAPPQARIGLVVDRIFAAEIGFVPSRDSENYRAVSERVASILLDGIQGQLARMEGRVEPKPRDQALTARPKESREGNRPLTEAAEFKLSAYYSQV